MKRIREAATIILVAPAILLPQRLPFSKNGPVISVAHADEEVSMTNAQRTRDDERLRSLTPIPIQMYMISLERSVKINLLGAWGYVDPATNRSALQRPGAARVHDDNELEMRSAQNSLDILAKLGALGDIRSLEVTGRMNEQTRDAIRRARNFFHVATPPGQRDDLFDAALARAIVDSLNNVNSELRTRMAQAATSFARRVPTLVAPAQAQPAQATVDARQQSEAAQHDAEAALHDAQSRPAIMGVDSVLQLRMDAADQLMRDRDYANARNIYQEVSARARILIALDDARSEQRRKLGEGNYDRTALSGFEREGNQLEGRYSRLEGTNADYAGVLSAVQDLRERVMQLQASAQAASQPSVTVSEAEVAALRGEAITSLQQITFNQEENGKLNLLITEANRLLSQGRLNDASNLYSEVKMRSDILRGLHDAETVLAQKRDAKDDQGRLLYGASEIERLDAMRAQLVLFYDTITETRERDIISARATYNSLLEGRNDVNLAILNQGIAALRELPESGRGTAPVVVAQQPHTVSTGAIPEERVHTRPTARLEELAPAVSPEVHVELQARAAARGSRRRAEGREVETPAPAQAQNTRPGTQDAGRETSRPVPTAPVVAPPARIADVQETPEQLAQNARNFINNLQNTVNRLFEYRVIHGTRDEGEGWRPADAFARAVIREMNTASRHLQRERYAQAVLAANALAGRLRTQIQEFQRLEELRTNTLERLALLETRMNDRIRVIQPIAIMVETRNLPSRWQGMLRDARTQHEARDNITANATLDTLERQLGMQVPEETLAQNRANANAIMDQIRALRNAQEVAIPIDEGEIIVQLNQNARSSIGSLIGVLEQRWRRVDGNRSADEEGMHAALDLYAEITREGQNILNSIRIVGGARVMIDERTAHLNSRSQQFDSVSGRLPEDQRNSYSGLLNAFREKLRSLERGGSAGDAAQSGLADMVNLYGDGHYADVNRAFTSFYQGVRSLTDLPTVPQPVEAPRTEEIAIENSISTIREVPGSRGVVRCEVLMVDDLGRQVSLDVYNRAHPAGERVEISSYIYIIFRDNYIVNPNSQERSTREFIAAVRGNDIYRVEYRRGRPVITNEKIAELTPEGVLTYESQNNPDIRRMLGIRRQGNTFNARGEYDGATDVVAFPLFR